jgi:hypothetical protein
MYYLDDQRLLLGIIDINKHIYMNMFKKDNYCEYEYYSYILHCNDIDTTNLINLIEFIKNIKYIDEKNTWIMDLMKLQIDYSESEFIYIIDNLQFSYIFGMIDNKKLSNKLIKKYIIPSYRVHNLNLSLYNDFISHPNVYLEDTLMLNIDLNRYKYDIVLSNPNLPVPDINLMIKYINTDNNYIMDCDFISHPRITANMIDVIINQNIINQNIKISNIMRYITRNPNMTQLQLKRIIKYCDDIYNDIDWLSVFNNTNISIKYIKHIFAHNTKLFA